MHPTTSTNSFHPEQSQKVKDFCQTYCLLSKDRWADKAIVLIPWQSDWIDRFFGYGHYEDKFFVRDKQNCHIWISKKNGKSSLMAAISLWLALEKRGNEVVIISPTERQSGCIFNEAAWMANSHPFLRKRFRPRAHLNLIECIANNSTIKIVACAGAISGYNGDVILDEFAEFPPSIAPQVWAKVQAAGAVRTNPVVLTISTANYFLGEHPGYQSYLWSKEVAADPSKDPALLPIIHECPPDQWDTDEGLMAANPSIGYCLTLDYLRKKRDACRENPRLWNGFKILNLGLWTGGAETFITEFDYKRAECDFKEEDLHGLPSFWGLDVSRRRDLTAYVIVVPKDGFLYLIPRIFTPRNTLAEKEKSDKVPYRKWAEEGHIITCEGDTIDQDFLRDHILADYEHFPAEELRYDPWNVDMLVTKLTQDGIRCAELPCNRPSVMVSPTGEMERQFLKGAVRLPKNPCLRWNFQNAVTKRVGADGIIINKSACTARVDSCVASVIAISGWMANQDIMFADLDSCIFA